MVDSYCFLPSGIKFSDFTIRFLLAFLGYCCCYESYQDLLGLFKIMLTFAHLIQVLHHFLLCLSIGLIIFSRTSETCSPEPFILFLGIVNGTIFFLGVAISLRFLVESILFPVLCFWELILMYEYRCTISIFDSDFNIHSSMMFLN